MLIGLIIIAVIIFVAMRILLAKRRLSVRRFFFFYVLAIVGVVMIYLGTTGRLQWPFILAGSILPFAANLLRWVPGIWRTATLLKGLRNLMGRSGQHQHRQSGGSSAQHRKKTGKTSEVNTAFINMVLDHDTGQMFGEVVNGRFSGSELASLSMTELRMLYEETTADNDSKNLLEAYLDREHPDWREEEVAATQHGMTEQDALEILGLKQGASSQEIKLAHRRIMQKIHPDHGGSTFLASQVNEAKALLLGDKH